MRKWFGYTGHNFVKKPKTLKKVIIKENCGGRRAAEVENKNAILINYNIIILNKR